MSHNTNMPSEYFGENTHKFHEANSPALFMGEHAYGKSSPTSHGVDLGNNTVGPDLATYEPNAVHHSGMQTGGNKRNMGFHEANSPALVMGEHAYGKSSPTSHGVDLGNNTVGPDLATYEPNAVHHSGMQTGGSIFTQIMNPKTHRMVSIYGKTGKKILNNYMKYLQMSAGSSNMNSVRVLCVVGTQFSYMNIDISHNDNIEYICNEIAKKNNIGDNSVIQLFEVPKTGTYKFLEKSNNLSQYEIPETSTLVARSNYKSGAN